MKTIILIIALLVTTLADARLARSYSAKAAFARIEACPSTGLHKPPCAGYVIDHVKPLACGGGDVESNMQWQTIADGKAKDKWERIGCRG